MLTHVYFLEGDRQKDGINYGIECVSQEEARHYCQTGNGCFESFEALKAFHQKQLQKQKPIKENQQSEPEPESKLGREDLKQLLKDNDIEFNGRSSEFALLEIAKEHGLIA